MIPRPLVFLRAVLLPAAGLLSAGGGLAQGIVAPAPAAESPPEPARLSVFEVSTTRDEGYQARSTLSGTRTGELLVNVPVSISVMNAEFLQDIGADTLDRALEFAIGIQPEGEAYSTEGTIARGIQSSGGNSRVRNFFVWLPPTDTYNIERVEVIRGPNTVLYGETDPGGLVNSLSKRALGRNRQDLVLKVGSHGLARATVDVDRKLTEQLALRLNLLYQDAETWRNWEFDRRRAADLVASWRPSRTTTVHAQVERGEIDRNRTIPIPPDMFTNWTGAAVPFGAANAGATSFTNTGTSQINTSATIPFQMMLDGRIFDLSNAAYRAYRQSAGGTALELFDRDFSSRLYTKPGGPPAIAPIYASRMAGREIMPRTDNWSGPDSQEKESWINAGLSFQKQLGALTLELAGNWTDNRFDRYRPNTPSNGVRIDPNTNFPGTGESYLGEMYIDLQWINGHTRDAIRSYRAQAVYDADLGFTKQRLLVAWNHDFFTHRVRNGGEVVLPGTPAFAGTQIGRNQVRRRVYLADGNANRSTFGPRTVPGVTDYVVLTENQFWDTTSQGVSVAMLGQFLSERVRTMVGYRSDTFREYRVVPGARDADFRTRFDFVNGATWRRESQPSMSYGAVVRILPQLLAYANYAEAFRVGNQASLIDDSPPGPRIGSGLDYGLRFDLLGSRLTGGVTFYDIDFTNNTRAITPAVIQAFRRLMDQVDPADPRTFGGNDTVTTASTGYEIELVANPTKSWRLSTSYSHTKPVDTDSYPRFLELMGTIEKAQARIDPTIYRADFPIVDGFRRSISNGTVASGTRQNAFSLVTRYTFEQAWLKGFYVAGAARWKSELFSPGAAYGDIPAYRSYDGNVGYRTRLLKRPVTFTLSVQNLLDRIYVSGVRPGFYTYSPPREFSLTMRTQL